MNFLDFDIVWMVPFTESNLTQIGTDNQNQSNKISNVFDRVLNQYFVHSPEESKRVKVVGLDAGQREAPPEDAELQQILSATALIKYDFGTSVFVHWSRVTGELSLRKTLFLIERLKKAALTKLQDIVNKTRRTGPIEIDVDDLLSKEIYPSLFIRKYSSDDAVARINNSIIELHEEEFAQLLLRDSEPYLDLGILKQDSTMNNLSYYKHAILMASPFLLLQFYGVTDTRELEEENKDEFNVYTLFSVANELAYLHMLRYLQRGLLDSLERETSRELSAMKRFAIRWLASYWRTEEGIYEGAPNLRRRLRQIWEMETLHERVTELISNVSDYISEKEELVTNNSLYFLTLMTLLSAIITIVQLVLNRSIAALLFSFALELLAGLLVVFLVPRIIRRASRE